MASMKELRTRISSVKNTQQTTRAMKLVSAAKLRRAQDAIVNNRPFAKKVGDLIRLVSSMHQSSVESPLILGRYGKARSDTRLMLVLVSSDRGLCGNFNGSIIKAASRWVDENGRQYKSVEFAFVGRKAMDFFKNRGVKAAYFQEFGRTVTFERTDEIIQWIVEGFEADKFDEVKFVYNEFKNAMVQGVVVEHFLPVAPEKVNLAQPGTRNPDTYIVRPSQREILARLLEKHFTIQAYRILLESQASEHGARMVAMENATKNAGEMIRGLTLHYNKQRQAAITRELLEIIAGAESQKG